MQVNQVSLINYKILHQSLGGFRATQKLLVNSSNILPIAFLLLPSVAQSQTVDNVYREQQINNLTNRLDPQNMLNQPGNLSRNLLLNLGENQTLNQRKYSGINSAVMLLDTLALFDNKNELLDADGITGGLPKLWDSVYDINYDSNLEPEFWQTGAEVIKAIAARVQGDTSEEVINDSGVYRSLIIGATLNNHLNNQLNLLPTAAQKQKSSAFSLDLPENLPVNHQSDAGLSPENNNLEHNLFSGFFLESTGGIDSENLTIYSENLGKGMTFSLSNFFGNSETFSPGIASALLIDSSISPEILLSEGFRDILNPHNIAVNPVNYQTIIAPEIPYVYDGDENLTVAAINPDETVSDETVFETSEINAPWQETPAKVNFPAWSGLPPEFSQENRDRPPVNQKSGENLASGLDSIVLDQIADALPPQSPPKNPLSWSGLPSEFSPTSGDLNPVNQPNQAYFDRRLSWQDARISASWGNYKQGTVGNQSFSPPEPIENSTSFSNSQSNLDSVADSFPDSSITRTGEISEFAPSDISDIAENNPYTIQAKVLDSPVSYLTDRQSWSEAYSSLINRDLQKSLEAIALTTHSTPGVVYVLAFSDYLELMLLSPGQPTIRRIVHHANRDLLNATVQALIADVTNPRTLGSESASAPLRDGASAPLRERYLSSAQQLYQWLISPIEGELGDRGIDTLMFSLDPNIRSLPIAVLHDGQQFLVEKYRLSLIPSLNLTNLSYQNLAHSGVLAMGASEFADPRIQPLDQVPLELSAIMFHTAAANAQNRPSQVYINEAFTPENLKYQSDRGNYQIIHLATHVEFNPENTQNSYIQFWNRRLTLHEIQEIGWQNQPLELLVMSGCETAFGSPNAELGFAGLAVKNGVKSVLASLWQVDDQGTFGLMSEFYRHLNSQSQTIKAEALRQAQLAMLQGKIHLENGQLTWVDDNPQTYSQSLVGEIGLNHQQENISSQTPPKNPERKNLAHPYFWAAFTLVGNPW
jgi:CHAT domain-containing protein